MTFQPRPRNTPEARLVAAAERVRRREAWLGYCDAWDDETLADGLDALLLSGLTLTAAEVEFSERSLANFEAFGFLGRPDCFDDLESRLLGISRASDARARARGILQNRIDQVLELPAVSIAERLSRLDLMAVADLPF